MHDLDRRPSLLGHPEEIVAAVDGNRRSPASMRLGGSVADWTCSTFCFESLSKYSQPSAFTSCWVAVMIVPE